jgi:hypothetical protein
MTMLNLHPKIKAALLAYVVIAAGVVGAWAQGTLSQSEMVSALVAGAITVVTGYLKTDTSAIAWPIDDLPVADGDDNLAER